MNSRIRRWIGLIVAALMAAGVPDGSEAKGYSSGGGHSYSSSSSHSSSFGGSHSSSGGFSHSSGFGGGSSGGSKGFSSSSGKSYSSGSTWNGDGRKSYTSGKSYSSGSDRGFASILRDNNAATAPAPRRNSSPPPAANSLTFDTAAAHARREEASKAEFNRFKEAQNPRANGPGDAVRSTPPPIPVSAHSSTRVYIPDAGTLATRPVRIYNVFNPYYSRPMVVYRDPYNSFFWWWLLDRSLDDRAYWAYHHRYDMDPARYQALMATDQQLETRVEALEAQQAPRDPSYVPPGLEGRDLMYSDHYVAHTYSNRPTRLGAIAFWLLGIPTAMVVCAGFIWLVWFKRWQTAT